MTIAPQQNKSGHVFGNEQMNLFSRSSLIIFSIGALSLYSQTFASEPSQPELPFLGPKSDSVDLKLDLSDSTPPERQDGSSSFSTDNGDFDATEEYQLEELTNSAKMIKEILEKHTSINDVQTEIILEDLSLYGDFQHLKSNTRVELSFYDTSNKALRLSRIALQQSQYDRLRIEFTENFEPSIIKDCFPLAIEVAKLDVHLSDLLTPNAITQQLLDHEPNLLAYIDSQSNITKDLTPSSKFSILMKGRFRDEQLRQVDEILAIKINDNDEEHFIFHHRLDSELAGKNTPLDDQIKGLWFSDSLKLLSYPFIQHPTNHIIVSSDYGEVRSYEIHKGVDFAAPTGTPIIAAAAGIIKKSGYGTGYGAMVHITHPHLGEYSTVYAHMSKRFVKTGDYVHQGQLIGYVGETGRATGPHLHYEIRRKGHKIDPYAKVIKRDFSHSYRHADVKQTQSEIKLLMSSTNSRMIGGLSYALDSK